MSERERRWRNLSVEIAMEVRLVESEWRVIEMGI